MPLKRERSLKILMKKFIFLVFAAFIAFAVIPFSAPVAAEDDLSGQSDPAPGEASAGFNPGMWLISIFKDHISKVDGDRCPSVPTCSTYSVQAFKKHGFLIGWMMTVDRLIHEGKAETTVSPLIHTIGGVKIYDPVENNDFWWFRVKRKRYD